MCALGDRYACSAQTFSPKNAVYLPSVLVVLDILCSCTLSTTVPVLESKILGGLDSDGELCFLKRFYSSRTGVRQSSFSHISPHTRTFRTTSGQVVTAGDIVSVASGSSTSQSWVASRVQAQACARTASAGIYLLTRVDVSCASKLDFRRVDFSSRPDPQLFRVLSQVRISSPEANITS